MSAAYPFFTQKRHATLDEVTALLFPLGDIQPTQAVMLMAIAWWNDRHPPRQPFRQLEMMRVLGISRKTLIVNRDLLLARGLIEIQQRKDPGRPTAPIAFDVNLEKLREHHSAHQDQR